MADSRRRYASRRDAWRLGNHPMVQRMPSAPATADIAPPRIAVTPEIPSGASAWTAADAVPCGGRARLLTASAMLAARPGLGAALRAVGCEVRATERWDGLLDEAGYADIGAALVDLDRVEQAAGMGSANDLGGISARRLIALLAARARAHGFVVLVQTALDFAEIDDLARLGIQALIHPSLTDEAVAPYVRRAVARWLPGALASAPPQPSDATEGTDAQSAADVERADRAAAVWTPGSWREGGSSLSAPSFG